MSSFRMLIILKRNDMTDNSSLFQKMQLVETALFTNSSHSVIKIPASIIRLEKTDTNGNVWFRGPRAYVDMSGCELGFHSQLQFYNKNYPYYLSVEGSSQAVRVLAGPVPWGQ